MLLQPFSLCAVVLATAVQAIPTTINVNAARARYEVSSFVADGVSSWTIRSLNTTSTLAAGAILQITQNVTGNDASAHSTWTVNTLGNTEARDVAMTQQVQLASRTTSQPPTPAQDPNHSSAAAQAASVDRGDPVLQIASQIGQRVGDRVGAPIGAVVGVFIGVEIGSVIGGPIGQYIGRLVGSGINYAFGP